MVRAKRPNLVFLMETKTMHMEVEGIRRKLGFDPAFNVDCKGRSGGLILLWNTTITVEIQNYSRRHINAVIPSGIDDNPWKFTGFYGHPKVSRRGEAWSLLRHLAHLSPEPWLCVGDFNEITTSAEKSSFSTRPVAQMKAC